MKTAILFSVITLGFAASCTVALCAEGGAPLAISWDIAGNAPLPAEVSSADSCAVFYLKTPSYLVDAPQKRVAEKPSSVGALFDFKYFSGLNYDILRDILPGKKINLRVLIPYVAGGGETPAPDRVKFVLKSLTDGEWREYHSGKEFTSVRREGYYDFELVIPERPVSIRGKKSFIPRDSIAIAIEYIRSPGNKSSEDIFFLVTDLSISGINIPHDKLRWQLTRDGYVAGNTFLPYFPAGSALFMINRPGMTSLFRASGKGVDIARGLTENPGHNLFQISAFLTRGMSKLNGSFSLFLKSGNSEDVLAVNSNDFNSSDKLNYVNLLLDADDVKKKAPEYTRVPPEIYFSAKTEPAVKEGKFFFLTLPPIAIQGEIVPFDSKWKVRDAQGLGGYKCVDIIETGGIGACHITISQIGKKVYQTRAGMLLRGGIDWTNPFYKVELVRYFDNAPIDISDSLLEVHLNPLTDTSHLWQKPYRARLGLIDDSGSVIFGANVSISENTPARAFVRATTAFPLAKGFTMRGFNPKKVAGILINIEASHETLDTKEIRLSFRDLIISKMDVAEEEAARAVDFNRFKITPGKWLLTRMIKDSGGFLVGINYPFPNVPVPKTDFEVPQVYPLVGMKYTDPYHIGGSSSVTSGQMLSDFRLFARKGMGLVRIFLLGDTHGVFKRDLYDKKIGGFDEKAEKLFSKTANMDAANLARFISDNEKLLFKDDDNVSKNNVSTGNVSTSNVSKNRFPGLAAYVFKDMAALLDILEETENSTGRKIAVIITLYDFMLGDDIIAEGPNKKYLVAEHPEIVTDPVTRAKALAITWKMMRQMKKDPRFLRYVAGVEFMNEPLNAVHFNSYRNFNKLINFVSMGVYLLKDALGDEVPVSVGFRCWLQDLSCWKNMGDGIDMLLPHYWESLESYNINVPAVWPLDMPAASLWGHLGTSEKGRITGIGEISPGRDPSKYLFVIEKAGYDLALLWSYSGHDGHDIKPFLNDIARYQQSNVLIKKLQNMPSRSVREAFAVFENGKTPFAESEDTTIRRIAADIKRILDLKAIPPSGENIGFLKKRILR